ncbi:MAG: transketolase [Dethiosulfovibrio peptidovorans]|nr:MAG: transketolase [Dethiosulfovibrio peptidovorans]
MADKRMDSVLDDVLISLAADDPYLVVLHADVAGTRLPGFSQVYPERSINLGMSEQDLVATGAGMAAAGKSVWLFSSSSRLLGRGYDALRTAIAVPGLPVRIVAASGGLSAGEEGAEAQMLEDLALMRGLPGVAVEVPCDGASAEVLFRRMADSHVPVFFRLCGEALPDLYTSSDVAETCMSSSPLVQGTGVTICACGIMVHEALHATSILAQQDISAEVVDCHSVKPLSERAILGSVHRTGCCVVAEEHGAGGGLGEAVSALLSCRYPVPIRFVSVAGRPGQSGVPGELREYYGLTYQHVVSAAVEAWTMRRR